MSRFVLLTVFVAIIGFAAAQEAKAATKSQAKLDDEELEAEQNKNAHYSFDVSIDDQINDNTFQRSETRDGLTVKGSYSYNDGFFLRTIEYEADDKGYRVVSENVEPVGDGPTYNPNGHAEISGSQIGTYTITEDDIGRNNDEKPKKV